jgi:hypothetical protein
MIVPFYKPRHKDRVWPELDAEDPISELAMRALVLIYREAVVNRNYNGDRATEVVAANGVRIVLHHPDFITRVSLGPYSIGANDVRLSSVLRFNLDGVCEWCKNPEHVLETLKRLREHMILEDLADV